jgi:mannose-6-phosphate isomerase-like protein (cupin superfamily)
MKCYPQPEADLMTPQPHRSGEPHTSEPGSRSRLQAEDVLDLNEIGMMVHVRKDPSQTGGQSFDAELVLHPHAGGTPIHVHPDATESYRVLEGKLDVYVDGTWTSLEAGEQITVDKGVPHTFRNPADGTTRVYNTHQPAMRFDQFFLGLSRVANSGVVKSGKMSFRALLALAVLWTSFEDEIRSVRPPHLVMRVLGGLGRALGYRFP